MSERADDLPIEIRSRVLSFCRDVDGTLEVADMMGLVNFILDNSQAYPALLNLVKLNEAELIRHFQETGQVPPGVKLIKTTTVSGQNVTRLEIFHGPTGPKNDAG